MSAEDGSIRILAVDDHSLVRAGIATLIAGQPDMRLVAEWKSWVQNRVYGYFVFLVLRRLRNGDT